jgi:hypothetical protein
MPPLAEPGAFKSAILCPLVNTKTIDELAATVAELLVAKPVLRTAQ